MKKYFVAVLWLLFFGWAGMSEARAQYYPGYGYPQITQPVPPQNVTPYYQLEVMHYQLYLPRHQSYTVYYPFYPYGACCAVTGYPFLGYPSFVAPVPPAVLFSPRVVIRR